MRTGFIFWGVVLILLGGLFLLSNLGYLEDVNLWGLIWPILFIAFGVWVLLGAVLKPSSQVRQISVPLEEAVKALVKINRGVGKMTLAGGASPGELLSGEIRDEMKLNVTRSGEGVEVKCRQAEEGFMYWFSSTDIRWDLRLSREIPLTLKIETGIGMSTLDLGDLKVEELTLKPGVGEQKLTLPAQAGFTHAKINGGVGAVNIHIPAGVAARIRVQQGLGAVNVDRGRFPRSGNYYLSPDYASAPNKLELDLEIGIGAINITG